MLLAIAAVLLPCIVVGAAIRLLVLALIVVTDMVPQARSTFAGALALGL